MQAHLSGRRRAGVLSALLLLIAAVHASSAVAVGPGLPPGYQVQRIDSPVPATTGNFGTTSVVVGDVNNDGEEDFASNGDGLNNDGVVWVFSGETGQLIRAVNAADAGGTGARSFVNRGSIHRMGDIGSCPNAPPLNPAQPGPTCASATIGPPDGANEILLGAEGVDVAGVRDVGRVYVLDGATLAVLKRIDMPPADRALVAARQAENPLPMTNVRGGIGRTAVTPRGMPPCQGNAGVGDCPSLTAVPPAVRAGDLDGGGVGDIIVGANRFPETGSTADPLSDCARNAGVAVCLDAGRAYVYRGEEIAGSDPSVVLDGTGPGQTPPKILRNLGAQADSDLAPTGRIENFGHGQMPVGDLGTCRSGGAFPVAVAGQLCSAAARTTVADGRPDYVIAAHRADHPLFDPDPAFFETGASFLYDGATGAILNVYYHPEPVANALFGWTSGQSFALGNLGDTAAPDVVLPGYMDSQGHSEAGKAYLFSGNFNANTIVFGLLQDPTPTTYERFGNPTEGVGDLVPDTIGNEVLIGGFSSVQTPGKEGTLTDVHFFSPVNERALQTIADPDAQPESGFGTKVMPLGDLNEDGYLDFAVGAPRWDAPASGANPAVNDQGRMYIFRSDANAVTPPPPPPPPPPPGPSGADGATGATGAPGPAGPAGAGSTVVALAGRTIDLDASRSTVRRGGSIELRGVVEAYANRAACERGQSVLIQRRTPGGRRFTTFQRVRTDRTGAFRTPRLRPTRTRLYRARVQQSVQCQGAQSPRERVTVLRRR